MRDGTNPAVGNAARIEAGSYQLHAAVGHLLRRSQQRAVDLFVEEVGEDGPTPRQFAVLLSVHQNPGVSQTDLVRTTGIDRSTLTEILRRLGRRGLIRRERQPGDRRTNALHLTAEGQTDDGSGYRRRGARPAADPRTDPGGGTRRRQCSCWKDSPGSTDSGKSKGRPGHESRPT